MKILGLGHYSRTGKDTFANYLTEWFAHRAPAYRIQKVPFAWKLKQVCHELYAWAGMREPEFYDTKEGEPHRDIVLPAIGKTPVQIWVDFGTPAVRQQVYDRTWIDYLLETAAHDIVIIPDVRFPNEIEAIRAKGGSVIKIVRPGYGPRKTVADRALVGYDGWDYVFGGSGRLDELSTRAEQVAYWLLGDVSPIQTADERAAALAVENIEPWEPSPIKASKLNIEVDEDLGLEICRAQAVCAREGFDLLADLASTVKLQFKHLDGRNHFRELVG